MQRASQLSIVKQHQKVALARYMAWPQTQHSLVSRAAQKARIG